jgi:hypothetical protein
VPQSWSHRVHIFLDGSNLEVFADDRVAITTNLFPTNQRSICVGVDTSGGGRIEGFDVWKLLPAPVMGAPP